MRTKVIAYSIACCFVLGTLYLKNKVFIKKKSKEMEEEQAKTSD